MTAAVWPNGCVGARIAASEEAALEIASPDTVIWGSELDLGFGLEVFVCSSRTSVGGATDCVSNGACGRPGRRNAGISGGSGSPGKGSGAGLGARNA